MNLLIDIGNSRLKWCIENDGILSKGQAADYKNNDLITSLQCKWSQLDQPEIVAISSVSDKKMTQKIIAFVEQNWSGIKVLVAKPSAHALSITNSYSQPEKLGVDRWMSLIALHHYYPGNSCVVDCGTAITIDCLDENGQHLGGLIAPGVQLMKQSLSLGTEDLSLIKQNYPVELSNSTEPAIFSGTLYAAVGLIEKSMSNLCMCDTLVLTGGDAELLAENLNLESTIEPDFVLKGLFLYCHGGSLK